MKIISKPYSLNRLGERDLILFTMGMLCLFKILLFSLTIQTPQMGWEWEIKTVPPLVVSSAGLLALILAPAFLFPQRRIQLLYGILLNGAITFAIIANRIYNMFFHSYISLDTVMHSHEALSMSRAVLSTMRFWELLWAVDLVLLYFLVLRPYRSPQDILSPPFSHRLKTSLSILTLGFFAFAFSLNYMQLHRQQNINMRESGILLYFLREAAVIIAREEETMVFGEDIQDIKKWFAGRWETEGGDEEVLSYYGKARGKNLIVLHVEALQEKVIGKTLHNQEITPNLNRIKEESVYFKYCFDQVEMASADAEVLVNLSLYPLNDVSVYMRYPDNYFNSLARTLCNNGYRDKVVFHGMWREFYNRKEAYPNMGFNRYFSLSYYDLDEMHNGLLGDKTFLTQTAAMLEELSEPYYAFILTLTSHHPFNYLEDYDEIDVYEYEGTIVGDYIRSIHYTDAAVGLFYDLLKEKGILDDSLLVIYGDHVAFNYNEKHLDALNMFFGADMRNPFNQLKEQRVPLFIRFPEAHISKVVQENAGMVDIFPTVANLLGVHNPYLMGRDLFNSEEEMVILKRGSFIKDNYLFHAPTRTMYDLETEAQRLVEDEHPLVQEAEKALEISEKIHGIDFYQQVQCHLNP